MIPLLDLTRIHAPINAQLKEAACRVIDHGRYILGSEVAELEQSLQAYTQSKHAITCASGSDAILLALQALQLAPGDEVITTPYTFFSTVSSIERLGLKTVFADILPGTFNINPSAIIQAITPKTRAIIAVHLFGQSADLTALKGICEKYKLFLIEDAAQSLGASWEWQKVGTFGDVGTYSFFPSKNLGGLGDGGAMVTDSATLAERLKMLRVHGMEPKYYHKYIGLNSRLDTLQAALIQVKLPHLDSYAEGRRRNAALYRELFHEVTTLTASGDFSSLESNKLVLPVECPEAFHVYNQFVIRVQRRDALRAHLNAHKIGNEVYYPVPLHLQECFTYLGYEKGDMPHSERAAETSLALPIFGELTTAEIETVASAVIEFLHSR